MKTTLKDIAFETGYSISTVSRVLSGSNKISGKTKNEIIRCAERLHYPFDKRQVIPPNKSELNVALLTDFHEVEFYAAFFYGFSKVTVEENVNLALYNVLNPDRQLDPMLSGLSHEFYDGIVLYAPEMTQKGYKELMHTIPHDYPIVSISVIENPVISTISFDSYGGGYLAGEHFEKRNYHKLGIIKGPFNKAESRYRYNGYKDFIAQSSVCSLVWEIDGEFRFEDGVEAFKEFEQLDDKPQAVFACNDMMAKGFAEAAKYHGYRIPEDIAILGYDDLPMCENSYPSLSSVHTDFEQLGRATLEVLKRKIYNHTTQTRMLSLVPVSISTRKST